MPSTEKQAEQSTSLFHSIMTYGLLLWGASAHTKRIFTLQKRAVRVLETATPTTHARPFFKKYNIMTVYSAYIYLNVLMVKNEHHERQKDVHDHDTRGREMLTMPHRRLLATDTIHNNKIRLYNALPMSIKARRGAAFQRELKQFLTEKAFYSIEEFLHQE